MFRRRHAALLVPVILILLCTRGVLFLPTSPHRRGLSKQRMPWCFHGLAMSQISAQLPLPIHARMSLVHSAKNTGCHRGCQILRFSSRCIALSSDSIPSTQTAREKVGCYYMDGVTVARNAEKGGYSLIASRDLPSKSIVLLEQRMLAEAPIYLTPRSSSEVPVFNLGVPLKLLPAALFEICPALLAALRISQNSYPGLSVYAIGSFLNHACLPNARAINLPSGCRALVTHSEVAAGEELTVSYLGGDLPSPWQRRVDLMWRYGFWCNCCACRGSVNNQPQSYNTRSVGDGTTPQSHIDVGEVQSQARHILSIAGLDKLPVVSAESSYNVQITRLLPLVVLQTIIFSLASVGALWLISIMMFASAG
mmetsp:Transcript_80148/g.154944  ORF Transcript_80148/g.154944 Transcript_80148/m.154944 type:complete len:366 (-) Transcript_80148:174-1271(-)